jgi:hypothetical protein
MNMAFFGAAPYVITDPAPATGSGGWGVFQAYLVIFGGAGGWLWYRKIVDRNLLDVGDLAPQMAQPFVPGGVFYPENEVPRRPYRGHYWMGFAAALVFLLTCGFLSAFLAWVLILAGIGSAAWMFFYSKPPQGSLPAWANFQPDHLVVTAVDGSRAVFVLGSRVSISLELDRTPLSYFSDPPPNLHRFFMVVSEGESRVRLPLEFTGSGEYLAICRKEGATVEFTEGLPPWFEEEMRGLPSWQRSHFDPPPELPRKMIALVCLACGSSGSYEAGRNAPRCQFCDSSELRNPGRK